MRINNFTIAIIPVIISFLALSAHGMDQAQQKGANEYTPKVGSGASAFSAFSKKEHLERAAIRQKIKEAEQAQLEAKADRLAKLLGFKSRTQVSPMIFSGLFEDPADTEPDNLYRPASPYALRKNLESTLGIELNNLRPFFQK